MRGGSTPLWSAASASSGCSGETFDAAMSDRACRLVTVVGPAGIGKSRLTAELCRAVEDDARVLVGPCLPYGDGITFWPLVRIVGSASAATTGFAKCLAGADDADLIADRVLGAVGPTPTVAPGGEMFWAVRRLFEELAREQPLLVVVEDIHWAEPKLLDLLEYLAGWTDDAPILLALPRASRAARRATRMVELAGTRRACCSVR